MTWARMTQLVDDWPEPIILNMAERSLRRHTPEVGEAMGRAAGRLWHLHRPYEPMEVAPWSKSMISAEAWPRLIRSRLWWWSSR